MASRKLEPVNKLGKQRKHVGIKQRENDFGPPAPTGIKLEPDLFSHAKTWEKSEVTTSDRWNLVDAPHWLHSEARSLTGATYRKVSSAIQEIINNTFSHSRNGTIAVLALGIALRSLKRELRILNTNPKEYIWGERREKIRILKSYKLSEFIFNNHAQRREDLLAFLTRRIEYKETLMREVAKEFGIEIPINPEFTFFDEKGDFDSKVEAFKGS